MRQFAVIFMFILLSLTVTGCLQTQEDAAEKPKKGIPVSTKITGKDEKNNQEYSFLEKLPSEKLKQYNLFSKDKNISHLANITPEQMLLVYFQSVIKDDVEGIYAITYGHGEQSFDAFKSRYYENLLHQNYDLALRFREYDSIENKKENDHTETVVMKVSIGSFTDAVAIGLKKDQNIWKLDIPPITE